MQEPGNFGRATSTRWSSHVQPVVHLIGRGTPGRETPARVALALDMALPVGMAGGLWQGPPEGQLRPVSGVDRVQSMGHVKLWV